MLKSIASGLAGLSLMFRQPFTAFFDIETAHCDAEIVDSWASIVHATPN